MNQHLFCSQSLCDPVLGDAEAVHTKYLPARALPCPLVPYMAGGMAGGSDQATMTSHKFMGHVEQMFKNLPTPLEWRAGGWWWSCCRHLSCVSSKMLVI